MIASSDESTIAARYSGDRRAGASAGGSSLTGIGPGHCKPLASRRARTCVARLTFEPSPSRRRGGGPARARERRSSLDLALLRPCAGAEGRGTMEGHSTKSLLRVISLALALSLALPLITPAAHAQAASPTTVYLPNVTKMLGGPDGWLTTFVIQNLGTAPANAKIAVATDIGDATGSVTIDRVIQPGRSAFVDPRSEQILPAGSGAATITADQPIAVVANVHNDAAGTPFPRAYSYNGVVATGSSTTYLPYAAKNADGQFRSTKLWVQNAGAAPAGIQIELRKGGKVVDTFSSTNPLRPGQHNFLDLGKVPTSSVPDGEYGVVITGGQFAVLAQTTTQTTATGYTGA